MIALLIEKVLVVILQVFKKRMLLLLMTIPPLNMEKEQEHTTVFAKPRRKISSLPSDGQVGIQQVQRLPHLVLTIFVKPMKRLC